MRPSYDRYGGPIATGAPWPVWRAAPRRCSGAEQPAKPAKARHQVRHSIKNYGSILMRQRQYRSGAFTFDATQFRS